MVLSDIVAGIEIVSQAGATAAEVASLGFDSRQAAPGQLFFAIRGGQSDGHDYIEKALDAGAVGVVCEKMPDARRSGVTYLQVADSQAALGIAASNFYDNPSAKLRLVGVTGTNGKTTTVTLLYDLFRKLGYKAGLISTVVYRIDDREIASTHTTPDAIRLNAMMAEMVAAGCEYCFMEVSSHAVVQRRIEALTFAGGIFSNLTHDHLDYHESFAAYLKAKKRFFDGLPAGAFALVNADDRNGRVMVQNTRAQVRTFSLQGMADFRARIIEMLFDGMLLHIDGTEVWVRFLGRFNAYNLLSVYAAALLLGVEKEEALRYISSLEAVSGRFEYLRSADGVTAIVDYAHTPDALENVIRTIHEIRNPGQKFYVVVGCGGNRDAEKRPKMAHIAASESDLAILTSDNPRHEEPEAILAQMRAGVQPGDRSLTITDRREAIRAATMMASPGDIILVAGKGHEDYQIVGDDKHHFDDKEEIRAAFDLRMPPAHNPNTM